MPRPLDNPVAQALDKLIRDPEVLGKFRETLDQAEAAGQVSAQEAAARRRQIDEVEREMKSEASSDSN